MISKVECIASVDAWHRNEYNEEDAVDSQNHWPALMGDDPSGRDGVVLQAMQNVLSYVDQDGYKYIRPHDGPEEGPWGKGSHAGCYAEETPSSSTVGAARRADL